MVEINILSIFAECFDIVPYILDKLKQNFRIKHNLGVLPWMFHPKQKIYAMQLDSMWYIREKLYTLETHL